jgi:hypothetical protein
MSESEFPVAGPAAGVDAHIASLRASAVILRNSRMLLAVVFIGSFAGAVMALLMAVMVCTFLFPTQAAPWTLDRFVGTAMWAFAAFATGSSCPWLWQMGRAMAYYSVRLDGRGVDLNLGTRKKPNELFLAWDQIAEIRRRRVGNSQEYTVGGSDGSQARFTSYTFFRPKKVARLIAARAGVTIQKG